MEALTWNTRQLLAVPTAGEAERTRVEYHLASRRELYDKSILSADRHHSGAGEWVLRGDGHFYTIIVTSRPVYAMPQELCLAFDCYIRKTEAGGRVVFYGPPIEEVARDFLSLLSVWAREPLVPVGVRRENDRPIIGQPLYMLRPREARASVPRPCGIDGPTFAAVLKGMANAPDEAVEAALGAARLYRAALSQVSFDPSGAYVALVSALECLAGHLYHKTTFAFAEVEKFKAVGALLAEVGAFSETKKICPRIEEALLDGEHFVWQKFLLFIHEHLADDFWNTCDELYPHNTTFPPIDRSSLKWCLRQIYNARSKYVHGGMPYPMYVDFGMQARCDPQVLIEIQKLAGKQRYLPLFSWFERLAHMVMTNFMLRTFAPMIVQAHAEEAAEKSRILDVMAAMPPNRQESLKTLTRWTAGFVGAAIIGPYAPNQDWSDSLETVAALGDAGLIVSNGSGMEGSARLRNREIGEIAGEFTFGSATNPLRGNELLLPKAYESLFDTQQAVEGSSDMPTGTDSDPNSPPEPPFATDVPTDTVSGN